MGQQEMWNDSQTAVMDPEEAGVAGIDFGAGEITGSRAVFRYGRLELRDLETDNNHRKWIYTAYNDEHRVVGEECLKYPGEIYTNFKRNPEDAEELYGKRLTGAYTYGYLMEKAFCCSVRDMIRNRDIIGDCGGKEEKDLYLFVGRPAGNAWELHEKEYREILEGSLHEIAEKPVELEGGVSVRIRPHVIVYSEAEAAMANEYYRGNIAPDETVVVIDGGSSTFDCVIVRNGRVLNEYSRQVGAGMLERNMFDLCLLGEEAAALSFDERRSRREEMAGWVSDSVGNHMIQLRRRKEEYFGPNGNDGNQYDRYPLLVKGARVLSDIDDAFMNTVIHRMPVRIDRSYLDEEDAFGGNHTQDYPDFYHAVRAFFEGARARCADKTTGEPVQADRIILTGGATVMPFVQELAAEVFQTDSRGIRMEAPSGDRRYSVSRGLAYMGYVELTKYRESLRTRSEVHQTFRQLRAEMIFRVRAVCAEEIWKEFYLKNLGQWALDDEKQTLKDWLNMGYHIPVDVVRECVGKLLAEKDVVGTVNRVLAENFHRLFPGEARRYEAGVRREEILTAFGGELGQITVTLNNLLGLRQRMRNFFHFLGMREISWQTVLTPEEKRKIKDHVRENKPGIMSGLSAQIAEKTQTAVNRIYDTMLENTDRSLDAYMEGLMPYFVRSAAERRAFGEDKAQPEEGSGKAPWERAAERDAARSPQKGEAGAAGRDSQCQE